MSWKYYSGGWNEAVASTLSNPAPANPATVGGSRAETDAGAISVNELRLVPEQGRGGENRGNGERQARSGGVGFDPHADGVETVHVTYGVIDSAVVVDRIRSAIGKREKGVVPGIGDARTEVAEEIGGNSVVQCVSKARQVGVGAGAGL